MSYSHNIQELSLFAGLRNKQVNLTYIHMELPFSQRNRTFTLLTVHVIFKLLHQTTQAHRIELMCDFHWNLYVYYIP